MAKKIFLSDGVHFALVDDEDYDWLSCYRWHLSGCGGAIRWQGENKKNVSMHREIMGYPKMFLDHRDRDRLNNQKSNLRPCTQKENSRNRGPRRRSKSGYKGVHWNKSSHKWHAQIEVDGKNIYLGLFSNIEEAAKAYDRAALKYFQEFAYVNFPGSRKE